MGTIDLFDNFFWNVVAPASTFPFKDNSYKTFLYKDSKLEKALYELGVIFTFRGDERRALVSEGKAAETWAMLWAQQNPTAVTVPLEWALQNELFEGGARFFHNHWGLSPSIFPETRVFHGKKELVDDVPDYGESGVLWYPSGTRFMSTPQALADLILDSSWQGEEWRIAALGVLYDRRRRNN